MFKPLIGAEPMKAVTVDISGALLFEIFRLLKQAVSTAKYIREDYNISIFDIFANIEILVIEAHSTVEIKEPESFPKLGYCTQMIFVGTCSHNHRILYARVDKIRSN